MNAPVERVVDFECGGESYRVAVRYRIERRKDKVAIMITCPECGKPRLWGKDCGWCENGRAKPVFKAEEGMVGGQDGEASSAEDKASEATKIVREGEEY